MTPSRLHILLATDGSTNAERAADYAADLAVMIAARVTVASVAVACDPPMFPWEADADEHPVPANVAARWGHPHAERIRLGSIDVEEVVLEGHAADAIVAAASKLAVDVVVIGRHGVTDGVSELPGSVAEELTRRCPCALVIVP